MSFSQAERECWIEALGSRIRRHVETLVGFDTAHEIESEVGVLPNSEEPESVYHRDDPQLSRSVPPPTNHGIEEEP